MDLLDRAIVLDVVDSCSGGGRNPVFLNERKPTVSPSKRSVNSASFHVFHWSIGLIA